MSFQSCTQPPPPPPPSAELLHFHASATVPLQPMHPGKDGMGLMNSQALCVGGAKKCKRPEFEEGLCPTTPRERKRKHAHLSLKRKEAAETALRRFLDERRAVSSRLKDLLDHTQRHGECCSCAEIGDVAAPG
ncbi:hypothetical protein FGB62_72g017 [Gracilaria domingensis]|nr:hypothetical protein FGB62_72g017 [Gracilaria domingensis]